MMTTAQTTKRTGRPSGHSDKGNTWDGDDQDEDGTDDQDDGEDTRKDGNNEEENGNDKEDGNDEDSDNEGPARQRGEENETTTTTHHTPDFTEQWNSMGSGLTVRQPAMGWWGENQRCRCRAAQTVTRIGKSHMRFARRMSASR
jgi:hypothetical protein